MRVRIYQPPKNAMQSGRALSGHWRLEYETATKRRPEPLMGWMASGDTLNQVSLEFPDRDSAIAFAAKNNWNYEIEEPRVRIIPKRSYLDNFKPGKPSAKK